MTLNSTKRNMLIAGAVAVAALGLGAAAHVDQQQRPNSEPVVDATGQTIPTGNVHPADHLIEVVIWRTESDESQRPLLNGKLANVAVAAGNLKADVEVVVLNGKTDTSARVIARAQFAGRCAGTDNPECEPESSIATDFIANVNRGLNAERPARESDLPGSIVYLSRRRVELTNSRTLTAIMIGDGVSSVPGCEFGVVPLEKSTFGSTARTCLKGLEVGLGGMTVYLAGVGRSTAPDANSDVLRVTPGLISAVIKEAGGKPQLIDLDAGPTGLLG